jgi:hypothetical protein
LNVYIFFTALVLGEDSFPKHSLGKFLAQKKEGLGRFQTQIPKFGTEHFETLRGGKCFLAQIPTFGIWDLGRNFRAAVEVP